MRLFAVAALAAILTACGASAPPPAPTPPKPAIVALAGKPPVAAEAPKPETRVIDHQLWSITVPAGWTVVNDAEDGVTVRREKAPGVLPLQLQVISQTLDDVPAEVFVRLVSMTAEQQVPEGVTVTGVQRKAGSYKGRPTSLTQVNTDKHVFLGVFATVDEVHHTGWVVVSIAPMDSEDSELMGAVTQTFTLKTPPLPEDAAPAPAPKAAPKVTPKKTSFEL